MESNGVRCCSVLDDLELIQANRGDYEKLVRFHYRDTQLGPSAAMYAFRDKHYSASRKGNVAGVIVYSMPAANMELRNIALGDVFCGLKNKRDALAMVNKYVRCISRVIVEPRYRGIGLATRLVKETMPMIGVPIVEAVAVMGKVNPFFEKAGMKRYSSCIGKKAAVLTEAFGVVGIKEDEFVDAEKVYEKILRLSVHQKRFIDAEIGRFLQTYGKRRYMEDGFERVRFAVNRLMYRPDYFVKAQGTEPNN